MSGRNDEGELDVPLLRDGGSFWAYLSVGAPLAVVTILVACGGCEARGSGRQ